MLLRVPLGPTCLVLWTAMLPGDSAGVAAERGHSDDRCGHYWEDASWPVSTRLRPILGFGPYDRRGKRMGRISAVSTRNPMDYRISTHAH